MIRALDRIAKDRVHGARPLGDAALRAIQSWATTRDAGTRSPSRLRDLARRLERAQPAMANFARWAHELRVLAASAPAAERRATLRHWLVEEQRRLHREIPRLRAIARQRLPPRAVLVTLSRSATVREVLAGLSRRTRPREIVVLESRPGGEGRLFASDLRRAGLRARWVADARGPSELSGADALVIGADAIYSDGSVLHKVGTRRLATIARQRGKPVIVFAGTSKLLERRGAGSPPGPLFERTPARWLTEIWTDAGAVPGSRWRDSRPHPRRRTDGPRRGA